MIDLTLTEIESIVSGRLVPSETPASAVVGGSVQTDSRLVGAGSIFFALPGEVTDGHLFAAAAVENGAALVITERELDLDVAQIVTSNGLSALQALAAAVVSRVRALGTLEVIAITGSNGKTTTKNLLRAILSAQAPTVAPEGSFNNYVGAPISMLAIDEQTRYLIVEMGASAAGDIARLVRIVTPDIAVVLKVGLAHAGKFGGIDAVQQAKAELVIPLPETAIAVLNADDGRVAAMATMTAARIRTFGLSADADLRAEQVEATASGTSFVAVADARSYPVQLKILGEHHVSNALAALSVARELGIDLERAIAAIEEVPRAERWRMELLTPDSGAVVINDAYNASPDSTAAALKTLAQILRPGERSIAVLGEMAELGEFADEEHDRIGRLVVRLNIHKLVVVGHGGAAHPQRRWAGGFVERRVVARCHTR